jgi:TRAP-type C4-dicarboxylate transport system substrate-binding protein
VGTRDWGWEKLTKYIVEPGFYQVPNPLLVNLKTWNQLQEKMRKLLTEAAKEAEKKAVAHFGDLAKKERPILLQAGLQVIDLPAAEKEKFLKVAYEEGWKDIIAKSPQAGQELKTLLSKTK